MHIKLSSLGAESETMGSGREDPLTLTLSPILGERGLLYSLSLRERAG